MKLSENTYRPKVKTTYPYLLIESLSSALAPIISKLPKGDLPLCIYRKDTLLTIGWFSYNPRHLALLINLYKPTIVYSKTNKYKLNHLADYIGQGTTLVKALTKEVDKNV